MGPPSTPSPIASSASEYVDDSSADGFSGHDSDSISDHDSDGSSGHDSDGFSDHDSDGSIDQGSDNVCDNSRSPSENRPFEREGDGAVSTNIWLDYAASPEKSTKKKTKLQVKWTSAVHTGTYSSMQQARRELDISEASRFIYHTNYSLKAGKAYVYTCSSHVDCPRSARITRVRDDCFSTIVAGQHSVEPSETSRTGIDKMFELEVDNLLLGGAAPARCLMLLNERYQVDIDLQQRLPDVVQLRNRSARLHTTGLFDISTVAELMEWATDKMCTTADRFFQKGEGKDVSIFAELDSIYQDELLVLDVFHEALDDNEISLGIICSSRRLFRNILLARNGHRHHGIPGATDGTYRLAANNWTLIAFGCYGVAYNGPEGFSHRFYPFAYLFVRSETNFAYDQLFRVVKERSQQFFGYVLKLQFGSMDHADSIASAYNLHWPDIVLLDCWAHLARNLPRRKHLLTDLSRYEGSIKPQVHYLHQARNAAQFRALATCIMRNWKNLGETAAVDWFRKQYLSPKWKLWYYPASKSPGVTPNQNPIESHNRDIKRVVDTQLYASTKIVLNSSLPSIIAHFGTARDRNWNVRIPEPIRPYAEAPVPIECALKASILTRGGNFWKVKNGRGKVTGILFNSSTVMIGGKSSNPSSIVEVRAKRYLQSRKGHLQATDDVEHIEKNYLSLYLVQQLSDESFEHNWSSPKWTEPEILRIRRKLSCDCKAFYESGWLCAHVLASLNLIDKFNLPLLVKSVPARKPPGRPRKAPKTLHSKDPYNGQYSIDKLIDKLTNHPGSVIGWKVLTKHDTTDSRGDTTTRQRTGVIRPWVEEEERYYWEIELDRRADEASVPDVKVDIQQLAEVINFTYRARYPFV